MIGWGRLFGGSVSPLENEAGEQGGAKTWGVAKERGCTEQGGAKARGTRNFLYRSYRLRAGDGGETLWG